MSRSNSQLNQDEKKKILGGNFPVGMAQVEAEVEFVGSGERKKKNKTRQGSFFVSAATDTSLGEPMSVLEAYRTSVRYDVTNAHVMDAFTMWSNGGDTLSLKPESNGNKCAVESAFTVLDLAYPRDECEAQWGAKGAVTFQEFWHMVCATRMKGLFDGENDRDDGTLTVVDVDKRGKVEGPVHLVSHKDTFFMHRREHNVRLRWVDVADYSPLAFERLSVKYCLEPSTVTELLSGFEDAHPQVQCYDHQLTIILPVPILPELVPEGLDMDPTHETGVEKNNARVISSVEASAIAERLESTHRKHRQRVRDYLHTKHRHTAGPHQFEYAFIIVRGHNTVITVNNKVVWESIRQDINHPASRLRNEGPLYLVFLLMANIVRQYRRLLETDNVLIRKYEHDLETKHILTLTAWAKSVEKLVTPLEKLKRLLRHVQIVMDSLLSDTTYDTLRAPALHSSTPVLSATRRNATAGNAGTAGGRGRGRDVGGSSDDTYDYYSEDGGKGQFLTMLQEGSTGMRKFRINLLELKQSLNEIQEDADEGLDSLSRMLETYYRLKADEQGSAAFATSVALTIFFPLQFITGWCGMNFYSPSEGCNFEDQSQCSGFSRGLTPTAFWVVVGSTCVLTVLMAMYFKFVMRWL